METLYYYASEEKKFLDKVENKIVISFDEKFHSKIEPYLQRIGQIQHMELCSFNNVYIVTIAENSDTKAFMEDLKKQKDMKSVNQMYALNGFEMGVTDEIVLQFKKDVLQHQIDEMHKKYQVEVKKTTDIYHLLSVPIDSDALEVANTYQESGLVRYSHPAFVSKVESSFRPTDPFFSSQYYLLNTGASVNGRPTTAGADIRAEGAWDINRGNNNIVIAVIDKGISPNHPDLPNTRQVRLAGSNFASGSANDPSPEDDDNHGNACAGIIAASHGNEGIAGIAPNCKIMPIRVPFGSYPSYIYADAIKFAKNNGADIISNSWGYSSPFPNLYLDIVSAIAEATTTGRGGTRGCVVVFAAGNTANQVSSNGGFVQFPSNVNIPGVLTVGASDRNDYQANYSPTSITGSSLNQTIDIVAPSHRAYSDQIAGETFDVWTIDIPGNDGDNPVKSVDNIGGTLPIVGSQLPSSGTNYLAYTGHFGGTSAACPQVAGVAALMLSFNSVLPQNIVSSIIKATARKARSGSPYYYANVPGRPDGTWDERMGHGVVNAHAALLSTPYITGPSNIPYFGMDYTLVNPLSGTVTWEVTGPFRLANTTGVSTYVTRTTNVSGNGVLTAKVGGVTVAQLSISTSLLLITGPDTVSPGQTYVAYQLPYEAGATYNWGSEQGFLVVVSNGSSTGAFNVPLGTGGNYDRITCYVALNGATIPFYNKEVYIQ